MGGVDPHELSPLLVGQSVDEWIVVQAAFEPLGLLNGGNALLGRFRIFAHLACGRAQTRQRGDARHRSGLQDSTRHPIADRSTEDPGNAKTGPVHFPLHGFGQVLANLAQIPAFELGIAAVPQSLDLSDHFVGRVEFQSSLGNVHLGTLIESPSERLRRTASGSMGAYPKTVADVHA